MLKIVCDRCGKPCDVTHGRLNLTRAQHASSGEVVASDDFKGLDLCDICTDIARTEWGFKIAQNLYKIDGEMEFTVPQPGYTVELVGGGGSGGPSHGGPGEPLESRAPDVVGQHTPHWAPPDDDTPPRTLAVGMVVDRAIATRWNLRNFGSGAGDEQDEGGRVLYRGSPGDTVDVTG